MVRSKGITESPAHLSITTWLEALEIDATARADGADLRYQGEGPHGPVTITALSPFRAEPGVMPMCSPSLVRAEVGSWDGEPKAWAPYSWQEGGIAFFAASETWCGGVLHTKFEPIEQQSDTSELLVTPMHPYVSDFLSQLGTLARLDWDRRRSRLAKLSDDAANELADQSQRLGRALRKAGKMALWGGGGAFTGGWLAFVIGIAIPESLPIAAGVGLVSGVGLGLAQAARAARIRLWSMTRNALETIESTDLFEKATIAPESHKVWRAGVLLKTAYRDVGPTVFRADNRIQAASSEGDVTMTVDVFGFKILRAEEPNPESRIIPERWAMIRVHLPLSGGSVDLGRLRPVDEGELVGWMSEDDLAKGALDEEVLRPLTLWIQQGRSGPYR